MILILESLAFGVLACITIVSAYAAEQMGYDKIQTIPSNSPYGSIERKFQPVLIIGQGCDAFPAVDKDGVISSGMSISGYPDDRCDKSTSQTYSRTGYVQGVPLIMYAWYFPKKQASVGVSSRGHRHTWANVIVWLTDLSLEAKVTEVSMSHDSTVHYRNYMDGWPKFATTERPLIMKGYAQLEPSDDLIIVGQDRPLLEWNKMPLDAKQALEQFNFGPLHDEKCPFSEANFETFVEMAALAVH